ncbi:adhesion G-protein coupled receptor G6 [Drosophila virilis]|nr:adhesion G-protein coupled receptor G6 [Drosophila virilis]
MLWQFCLLCGLWTSQAHVRFTPSTNWSSVQQYPPQQWQARNYSRVKVASKEQNMKLQPVALCEAQDFQHNYEVLAADGQSIFEPHLNHFECTRAGEWATMRDLCLDEYGLPWRRLCNATAQWQPLNRLNCRAGNQLSRELYQLGTELLVGDSSNRSKPVPLNRLQYLLSQANDQLTPVDVYSTTRIITKLLEQQPRSAAMGADLVSICQQIMSGDAQVLRLSAQLNATNSLLSQFEEYMDALPQELVPSHSCGRAASEALVSTDKGVETLNYAHLGVQALMSNNLSVFYVNPTCANITGIAIYSSAAEDRQASGSGFWYRFLYKNKNLEQLRGETNLETATYVPEQLWRQLKERGASYVILKVYAHAGLFVEAAEQRSGRPHSKVLSISIPGLEGVGLPSPLPFLLPRGKTFGEGTHCGYWNYKNWLSDGVTTCSGNGAEELNVLCQAQHLTQFSFLIGGSHAQLQLENVQLQLDVSHEQLLDIISYVGCGLSLFGLLCIFLTAALVKKWRTQASTKVLLHLCLALALQLLLFVYLSGGEDWLTLERNWHRCLILGAALQYSVLVIFSWMLIIAFLQFQRYVTVIGVARPNHYILISALIAWTLPLLPTLSVVLLDAKSFKPSAHQLKHHATFCYPSGYGLALGVVLPIALVTIANAFMMICIIYSIQRALNPRRKLIVQQLRLSVLLFFLLGLTWIFGLCSYLHLSIVFSYLFCLTATFQGFVLFVYFVLLNKTNRNAWLNLMSPKQFRLKVPKTEQQSMTTSSSNNSRRMQS